MDSHIVQHPSIKHYMWKTIKKPDNKNSKRCTDHVCIPSHIENLKHVISFIECITLLLILIVLQIASLKNGYSDLLSKIADAEKHCADLER